MPDKSALISSAKTLYIVLLLAGFFGCHKAPSTVTILNALQRDTEITIRNWRILGPFKFNKNDSSRSSTITTQKRLAALSEIKNVFQGSPSKYYTPLDSLVKDTLYHQAGDFTPLDQIFGYKKAFVGLALAEIYSTVNQDIAILTGVDNHITIWINDKLVLEANSGNITKNEFAVKVHLKKGSNSVILKVCNFKEVGGFHLDISSVAFVRKYGFGDNFYSISNKYLINTADTIELRIKHRDFVPVKKNATLSIFNHADKLILQKEFSPKEKWTIPADMIPRGCYKFTLRTDSDTFNQNFFVGDFRSFFNQIKKNAPIFVNDTIKYDIASLLNRFQYLEKFGDRNGWDETLERKASSVLFDLQNLTDPTITNDRKVNHTSGLHIRGYKSRIDNVLNNYMVYIPSCYNSSTKVPLVVVMPWVAKQNPFLESWHLAFIDYIENMEMLAERYGFGILWESSRIYQKYNLNPIVHAATFEALEEVKRNYHIDTGKIYLTGSCSGGLQALLMANRFPGCFKALGIQGPEISYTQCKGQRCDYPADWVEKNNFLNSADNFYSTPVYIASSPNDYHASGYEILKELITGIKTYRGKVVYNDIHGATVDFRNKMVPDNIINDQIFNFFKKCNFQSDTLKFSTYQLKYNGVSWLALDAVKAPSKTTIIAYKMSNNKIKIFSENLKACTIDCGKLGMDKNQDAQVFINGLKVYSGKPDLQNKIVINRPPMSELKKNHLTEGPVNDIFAKPFIVVKGTADLAGETSSTDSLFTYFLNDWQYNYFGICRHKLDTELNEADINDYNLVVIGAVNKTSRLFSAYNRLPLKIDNKGIRIFNNNSSGSDLNYCMIYPNPVNPSRYMLVMGTNSKTRNFESFRNLSLKGWNDYHIYNLTDSTKNIAGNFDQSWH